MKDGHHRDSVVNMEFMIPSDVLAGLPVVHGHKRNLKNRFELKRTLGEGTYGKVKLAIERTTREPVRPHLRFFMCLQQTNFENAREKGEIVQNTLFFFSIFILNSIIKLSFNPFTYSLQTISDTSDAKDF